VTHRDIKPGNLLYAAAPTDVRVGDFGLALNLGAETTQITGVGSPAYMSPEQIREELVDHRTDIYSLGVVMYQMLTGKLPFQGTNKFSMIYQITQFEPAPPSSHRHECPRRSTASCAARCTRTRATATRRRTSSPTSWWKRCAAGSAPSAASCSATPTSSPRCATCLSSGASPSPSCGSWCASACGSACRGNRARARGRTRRLLLPAGGGEARVTKNRKLLTVLGPGECFGEMAYLSLDRRERGATVTTSQDSHVVRIRIADLEKATVSCRSNVDRAFIGILVERLNLANTRLTSG
jgi:hypothetical protein